MKTAEEVVKKVESEIELNLVPFRRKLFVDIIRQAMQDVRKECAEIASYKGGLSKVETWSLNNDEIHDAIEEKIRNLKIE